nr:COX15/CtaA family protein [Pyrinomonadaceae bacterium]
MLIPATLIPLMLAAQIGLGAWVVWLETPALPVMIHLTFAMIILGMLNWITVLAGPDLTGTESGARSIARPSGFCALVYGTTAAVFLLVLVGAYVRASGAGWACVGFPGCNGLALPFGSSPAVDLHLAHRLLAYVVAGLVFATAWQARRAYPAVVRLANVLVVLVLVQIGIGVTAVLGGPGWVVQSAHVAGAAAVWSMAVALAGRTWRAGRTDERQSMPDGRPTGDE